MDPLSTSFSKPSLIPSAFGGTAASTAPTLLDSKQTPSPQQVQTPLNLGSAIQTGGLRFDSVAPPNHAAAPFQAPVQQTSLSSYPVGNYSPQNFSVQSTGNTYDSSKLSPGAVQDLLDARRAKEAAMLGGTNLDGSAAGMTADGRPLIPSDTLQGQIANQLYQSKLYSPEEQSLIQGGQDLVAQVAQKKLAARRQVTQLVEDGKITKEQGAAFVSEAERRANTELADLSVAQDSNTARLTALGLIRQNNTGALQTIMDTLKGSEVAPGSSVYNPITGVQFQGSGASPATIATTAQSLKQNDQMTGNIKLTPQGTVDDNYYYQQAQQMFASGGQASAGTGSTSGSQSVPGQIPQQVQTYLQASGGQYINEERVPAGQRDIVRQLAAQNGVPFLSAGDVSSVQSIDYTKANLDKLSTVVDQVLYDGALGKVGNIASATLNKWFPTSVARTAFNSNRETAIKQIQSLVAGSGSGFRLTQPEIDQAVSQMPTEYDTLSIAKAKLAWVNSFLDTKRSLALTGTVGAQTSAPGVNNVVQTKAGAIDTNW